MCVCVCVPVVKSLPSMHEDLGSIPSTGGGTCRKLHNYFMELYFVTKIG